MAERGVPFTNIFNFRDLGGYETHDGRTVRWGRLFRADDLSRLTEADYERFEALGIRTVIDLRRPFEVDEIGRIPSLGSFTYHHLYLTHPLWPAQIVADTPERITFLRERYQEMVLEGGVAIGESLRLIAEPAAAPLVFHCLAGKDRTGIIAALALSLLGVSDEAIADDYHLSEVAEPAAWAHFIKDRPDKPADRWRRFTVSPREAMLNLLEDLRVKYSSIEQYAESVGVTEDHIASMRAHLLEASSR
jgi:protein-tyrosine phosphatase